MEAIKFGGLFSFHLRDSLKAREAFEEMPDAATKTGKFGDQEAYFKNDSFDKLYADTLKEHGVNPVEVGYASSEDSDVPDTVQKAFYA